MLTLRRGNRSIFVSQWPLSKIIFLVVTKNFPWTQPYSLDNLAPAFLGNVLFYNSMVPPCEKVENPEWKLQTPLPILLNANCPHPCKPHLYQYSTATEFVYIILGLLLARFVRSYTEQPGKCWGILCLLWFKLYQRACLTAVSREN